MKINLLKLNNDKTELLVITSSDQLSKRLNISVRVGDSTINPNFDKPKNIGVLFDSTCSVTAHVSNVCKTINYNLYSIGKIRRFLDKSSTEKIIAGAITSRLDYCNSLLYGIPKVVMNKLQYCQNNAARIVSLKRKFDHISPVLKDLHWLPVEKRIEFKILTLSYKALNGEAPSYILDLLAPYTPARSLRSEAQHLLHCPKYRLQRFGKRSFQVAAPTLWNRLPSNIRKSPSTDIFKSCLKTYLFNAAYGQT